MNWCLTALCTKYVFLIVLVELRIKILRVIITCLLVSKINDKEKHELHY